MSVDPAVLEGRALTKVYRMGDVDVHALRGVDLNLHAGELVVLLGASGSGKSTLLNILGGLDVPSGGTVVYRDHDLTAATERELTRYRREHVGFVFQFYNLIPSLTARENVALVTEIADDPLSPEDALGLVGLGERMDHFPAQRSGGEQQRVAIARALAKPPTLLLCATTLRFGGRNFHGDLVGRDRLRSDVTVRAFAGGGHGDDGVADFLTLGDLAENDITPPVADCEGEHYVVFHVNE